MRRGDLVTVALAGDYGKPRPALVVQADRFAETSAITVLLVSATLLEAPLLRVTVEPSAANGLRKRSQVMVDRAMTVRRAKTGAVIGALEAEAMLAVTRALAAFLGVA